MEDDLDDQRSADELADIETGDGQQCQARGPEGMTPQKKGEDDVDWAQGRVNADILQRVLDNDFPKLPAKCLPPAMRPPAN